MTCRKRKPRQGWKEQFDQAEQFQQQISEEEQKWLDANLLKINDADDIKKNNLHNNTDGTIHQDRKIMANFIEGSLQGNGRKIGIVVSRFNFFISEKLLEGALDILTRSGVKSDDIDVARKSDSLTRARSI